MLKLLYVGDPHYCRQPSYLTPGKWRACVTDMLDAALAEAVRVKVHILVLLGDVFDHNNPSPQDHAEFTDWVFRAKEAGINVIAIPGNHDYGDADFTALEPYTRMRGAIRIIKKPTTLKIEGVSVRFYPWSPPDVKHNIGDIKDKTPYLIIHHEEIKGAQMDNGWLADGFVPRKKDFLVGGHLHTHQMVGKNAIYVGTALPHHWNHNVKGFTLMKAEMVDGRLKVQHTQVPYVPPFYLRELTLAEFRKAVRKDKRKVYYRVHAKTGEDVPDDKRIVSIKRLTDPVVANDNDKKEVGRNLSSLPDPLVWLVRNNVAKERRARAMKVLSSIRVRDEEEL